MFQVAATCIQCSPPPLPITKFRANSPYICNMLNDHCHRVSTHLQLIKLLYYYYYYYYYQIYFWNKTLHVSDSSSVHHQEFFTVHTVMVYVIQVCRQLSANLYDINHYCVYSEKLLMMDRGTVRNM